MGRMEWSEGEGKWDNHNSIINKYILKNFILKYVLYYFYVKSILITKYNRKNVLLKEQDKNQISRIFLKERNV